MSGANPPKVVFYEDEDQKNKDRNPEFWLLDEPELVTLHFGGVIVLPGANDADPDQRRDGHAGDRRHRGGNLLAAFEYSLRLLVVVLLRDSDCGEEVNPTIRTHNRHMTILTILAGKVYRREYKSTKIPTQEIGLSGPSTTAKETKLTGSAMSRL